MMQILDIKLLADFHLTYNGKPIITVNQPRLQSLLTYLLLHRNAQIPRHHLAFTFWPDTNESQARNNLRQMLHQLRRALPSSDQFLQTDVNSVYWLPDAPYKLDIAEFEQAAALIAEAEHKGDKRAIRAALQSAIGLYAGDLLPACYDDWIVPERERLRTQYQKLLIQLIDLLEDQRDYPAALESAHQLLQFDPLREETYLCLMRVYALNDNRSAALRTYHECVAMLERELGAEPGEEIKATYEQLSRLNAPPDPIGSPSPSSTSTPLIGRQVEWDELRRAWHHGSGGRPRFVLVTGEAGIGKTRLAEELLGWIQKRGIAAARTRAYEAEGHLAYSPVTDWLRSSTVLPTLARLDTIWRSEIARLLPELLTQYPDLPHPTPLTDYWQRQRFFEALARGILTATPPLLLLIDDLQWCDPETLEWLHFLLRFDSQARLLIVGTARAEEMKDNEALNVLLRTLHSANQIDVFSLAPLNASETTMLAASIAGHELEEAQAVHLFSETEGNPLFVGEMVRAGIGSTSITEPSPVRSLDRESLRLPPRVYAVIAGRLGRLSLTARKIAELGAAVGRGFSSDILQIAGQEDEQAVVQALNELWQRRIVTELGANQFDFTHDKLREVAYAEISIPERRLFHRRIAQALESLNADSLDLVSGQIAAHYEQAGLFEQAVPFYHRASDVEARVYANDDAIELLKHGLTLLLHLPPSPKRDVQELELQLALSNLYRVTKGWASPEEAEVVQRATILGDKVGDANQRLRTLFASETMYIVEARYGEVEKAHAQVEQIYRQNDQTPPPDYARINIAGARLLTGKFIESRELLDRITPIRDVALSRALQASLGYNFPVFSRAWLSHTLWCLGYPDAALQTVQEALELADEFMQPFYQVLAATYLALLREWSADTDVFAAQAFEAYRQTIEYRVPYYAAMTNVLLRFADIMQKPDNVSIERLRTAIDGFMKTGARVRLPLYLSLLARAHQRMGNIDAAAESLEQALIESQRTKEYWWDAEFYRLRGELRWQQGAQAAEVEAAFQRSLEIARSQQARSFELRAAISLARLWQERGKIQEAYDLLLPIYGWFTEGFDTTDLKAAKALLASLGRSPF